MTNAGNLGPAVEDKLVELVDQIDRGDFTDGQGHSARCLKPFVEAKSFLEDEVGVDVHLRAQELQRDVQAAYERGERFEGDASSEGPPMTLLDGDDATTDLARHVGEQGSA